MINNNEQRPGDPEHSAKNQLTSDIKEEGDETESDGRNWRNLKSPYWLIGILALSAALIHIAVEWTGRIHDPTSLNDRKYDLFELIIVYSPWVLPAVWGCIGSCLPPGRRMPEVCSKLGYATALFEDRLMRLLMGSVLVLCQR